MAGVGSRAPIDTPIPASYAPVWLHNPTQVTESLELTMDEDFHNIRM